MFSGPALISLCYKGLPSIHPRTHIFHRLPSANVGTKTENYNRVINLLSLKATGVRNVWIEILLSSCWLKTKKKYSFGEQADKLICQPSRWSLGGLTRGIMLICLRSFWLTKLDIAPLPLAANGPWSTQPVHRWEPDPPLCADTLMSFMWGALKRLLDEWN